MSVPIKRAMKRLTWVPLAAAGEQDWESSLPALLKRQRALLPFWGTRGRGPFPPLKLKSCELVTEPPPSARPPQELKWTARLHKKQNLHRSSKHVEGTYKSKT